MSEPGSDGHRRVLLIAAAIGVPIALASFAFVTVQHEAQHWVWHSLPDALGYDSAPWWWPLPMLTLAALIVVPIVTRAPGAGGHLPAAGLGGPPMGPNALPGVIGAAVATLPLGVVLGPEAPLMALGSGLALLAAKHVTAPGQRQLLATAGSTAAISTILGGPLVGAVLVVEMAAVAGAPHIAAILLVCLAASGVGALVFTGFGDWTGLDIGALHLPDVPADVGPDFGDFVWGLPLAVLVAIVVGYARHAGLRVGDWTAHRTAIRTLLCGVAVGGCIAAYALITGRSPEEAALSGQQTLADLAGAPGGWSVFALLALVALKGAAWAISLGSFRGGPIFPAILIGAAGGIACAGLPGFGDTPALAVGITAAAVAITGLPLSGAVLTVLLLGGDAAHQAPLIVLTAVAAAVVTRLVRSGEQQTASHEQPQPIERLLVNVEDDRARPDVRRFHDHLGLKLAGRHRRATFPQRGDNRRHQRFGYVGSCCRAPAWPPASAGIGIQGELADNQQRRIGVECGHVAVEDPQLVQLSRHGGRLFGTV